MCQISHDVFHWPPAYDNPSYSITVRWISLNFNDPSYGMLRRASFDLFLVSRLLFYFVRCNSSSLSDWLLYYRRWILLHNNFWILLARYFFSLFMESFCILLFLILVLEKVECDAKSVCNFILIRFGSPVWCTRVWKFQLRRYHNERIYSSSFTEHKIW